MRAAQNGDCLGCGERCRVFNFNEPIYGPEKSRQLEFGKVLKIPRKSLPWTLFVWLCSYFRRLEYFWCWPLHLLTCSLWLVESMDLRGKHGVPDTFKHCFSGKQWDDPQISPSRGFRCVGISRVFQWQLQDASRRSREKPPHYRKLANLTIDWHISSWGFRPVWKAKWKAVGQCWPSFSKFERHMLFFVCKLWYLVL